MNKTFKSFLILLPIFFVIIFTVTFGILNGYFEQDEWMGFASIIRSYTLPWWDFLVPGTMHFAPLGVLAWSAMYHMFRLNAVYYYLVELLIHASVTALVFIFADRLTKNKTVALIASLLFLLNGRAHQAFTHLAIFHSTDSAMLFILLFFVYLTGIKEKVFKFKEVIILFLLALAAVCFREEGLIIVPTFATYLWLFDKGKINKQNLKYFGLLGLGFVLFFLGRTLSQQLYTDPIPVQYQLSAGRWKYNIATIPIKLVVQNLINYQNIAIFFLDHHEKIYPGMIKNIYSDAAPLMDAAIFYIFSIFVSLLGIWVWLVRPKDIGRIILFFTVWIVSNSMIFIFLGYPIFVLEPRHLYISAFPVFCIVALFSYTLITFKSNYIFVNIAKNLFVIVALGLLLMTSYQQIRFAVNNEVRLASAKKKVLASLKKVHPNLEDNTIFYIKCKIKCYRNGELGIPSENVLPFPSGPGMVILVMYSQGNETKWGPFFTHYFLFDTFAEDYKKVGDRSFGYFTTKSKLEKVLRKNKLSKNIVVALEYNEENYSLRDISKKFRTTLSE